MPAKTAAPEATYEAFTAAGNKAVKEGMEKAMSAFGDMNSFSRDNVEAIVESITTAGKGVEELNTHMVAYTKQSMEESVSAAKRIASAKSMQEVLEAQTDYAKSSMEGYIGEMNRFTDLVTSAMKDSFKPINERVSATVEMFQAHR